MNEKHKTEETKIKESQERIKAFQEKLTKLLEEDKGIILKARITADGPVISVFIRNEK